MHVLSLVLQYTRLQLYLVHIELCGRAYSFLAIFSQLAHVYSFRVGTRGNAVPIIRISKTYENGAVAARYYSELRRC